MSENLHPVRFPNESPEYHSARDELLRAEVDLRRRLEEVAALRRQLPLGGAIRQDYAFEETAEDGSVRSVRMSELFQPGKDSLLVYSFMFGPEMKEACPLCTSFLDSLNGAAPHVTDRVNLAVVAKSPIDRIQRFGAERGWSNLRLLSSHGNPYNRDYFGETPQGGQMPSLNVFVRRGGEVFHFYHTEMLLMKPEPGQHPRHVDLVWPLWNLLDLTPEGRGTSWMPRLSY